MLFELTNLERKYVGLELVKDTWEKVKIAEDMYLYFDKNIIRKAIEVRKGYYLERKMDYETIENRTILLPKTNRGKPTKITPSLIRNKEDKEFIKLLVHYAIIAIPMYIISIVATFDTAIAINSFGTALFWGNTLMVLYNLIVANNLICEK